MGKTRARIALILSALFLAIDLIVDYDQARVYLYGLIIPRLATIPPWGWYKPFSSIPTKWVYLEADVYQTISFLWFYNFILIPIAVILAGLSIRHLIIVRRKNMQVC